MYAKKDVPEREGRGRVGVETRGFNHDRTLVMTLRRELVVPERPPD